MPRTARAVVGGYCYHLINRGNNRACVFHDPTDYRNFLAVLRRAQQRVRVDILAACLMPNHLHLVVRPQRGEDLARWTHWLFTTHVRRHHKRYETSGRVWQGRYKVFVIQQDDHLLTVLRYVERNALRAMLVDRAERWPWGSLRWRTDGVSPLQLAPSPVPLPANWVEYVNETQTTAELEAVRTCVNRQRPYGHDGWVEQTAHQLGLTQSLVSVGRPRKDGPQPHE
jgi:putative transposase